MERKLKCKLCNDIITAKPYQNMVWCKCKSCGLDISGELSRWIGRPENYVDLSDYDKIADTTT